MGEDEDEDVIVLARTLWGEARGEERVGMEAVASVIMNRVNWPHTGHPLWWGSTVKDVCKKKNQFEVWNEGNPNRANMETVTEDDYEFQTAIQIAKQAMAGGLTDLTGGATHFYAPAKINPPPSWTRCKGVEPTIIKHHNFYRIGPWSCPDEL